MDTKQVLTIGAYVVVGVGALIVLSKTKVLPVIPEQYLPDWSVPNLFPTALDTRLYENPPASQDPQPADYTLANVCSLSTRKEYNRWNDVSKWGERAGGKVDDLMFETLLSGAKTDAGCFAGNT